MLQTMMQHVTDAFMEIPFNRMLGLRLTQVKADSVTVSFQIKEELIGNFLHGILHGGVISSVMDSAAGMTVMADILHKHPNSSVEDLVRIVGKCSTIDLQISFLRPGKGQIFTATSWLVKGGNKISFTRMELHNQDGTLIATGSATYKHS